MLFWYNPGGYGLASVSTRTPAMNTAIEYQIVSCCTIKAFVISGLATLRFALVNTLCTRISIAPVQRLRIGMNPEETLMSFVRMPLHEGLLRVLEKELSNHGLRDGMYYSWIGASRGA